MGWFNYYGLAIMAVIMIPNILYAVKHKGETRDSYRNRAVIVLEQAGRYGCFAFMIFHIPYTYFPFWFDGALAVYLAGNGAFCLAYLIVWAVRRKKNGKWKALLLSILPSCVFLLSGIVLANIPLLIFAVCFAGCHIRISYKNAV